MNVSAVTLLSGLGAIKLHLFRSFLILTFRNEWGEWGGGERWVFLIQHNIINNTDRGC